MSESIGSYVITAEIWNALSICFCFFVWNQRRPNDIKTGDFFRYGENIGSESAISPFLRISFNNSELCDGKLSVSGFMDVIAGTFLAPLMGTDQRFMS